MIMEQERAIFKSQEQFANLLEMIQEAVNSGEPIDQVEKTIWQRLMKIGQLLTQGYVDQQGTGDFGPTMEHEGKTLRRLESLYKKRYVSVFGEISILRTVYGTRENQKHELIPLDARLNLPESDFSFLLQEWSQGFCVQGSYKQSSETVEKILGIGQSVRSLETMSSAMAQEVEEFRNTQPVPEPETEGSIVVVTADGKGVPMRREASESEAASNPQGRRKKGEKANKKRQACVGAVYTINPFCRQAEDVVNEIFRREQKKQRPTPLNKELRAELTKEIEGTQVNGKDQIFQWFAEQKTARNPDGSKPVVCIMDGDRALWSKAEEYGLDAIGILDICHVMERLWSAAYCFHAEGSPEAESFVTIRLTRILEGQVGRVIGGLRQMATKHNLRGTKKKQLEQVITYLDNNQKYMHYDYYLDCGYPIGSGVVEGACRHLVKDRMEGTGMRWRTKGAQSILDLRSVFLNDDWEVFQEQRIEQNVVNLYPYREAIQERWNIAA